ncbi:hypothetical protein J7382_08990 [Shimia sp. R11_0]|uniref:hypothetical protein n=1 Tax=Shimia sp. R11_0 TaxID=2821096 RepID=UPI001AD97358|nr:hypothetical protein [Shimia sp. R11_0]MBO9477666.1 hypothetical protein [Shimia sp. R11_0]
MYKYALLLFRQNWMFVLLTSVGLATVDLLSGSSGVAASVIVQGFLVFVFHAALLTGASPNIFGNFGKDLQPTWRFWVAYAVPLTFCIAAMLIVAFLFLGGVAIGGSTEIWVILVFLVVVPFWGVLIALIGTMVPAATLRQSISLSATLKRGRRSFWFVLWRLALGPGVFASALFALLMFLESHSIAPSFPETFQELTVINGAWSVLVEFIGLFSSALAASVLSMAYVRVEGGELFPEPAS